MNMLSSSVFIALCLAVAAAPGASALRLRTDSAMNEGLHRFLRASQRDVSKVSVPVDQWFTQRLDHFDPQNSNTFSQRYQVNATFYKPGGPVFVLLGGEGPANAIWIAIDTAIMLYAERFGAMVVQVEHRFYGKTKPTADTSDNSLRYLSSEQALADVAMFITSLKMQTPPGTKFITFGGSYSGALSAWFRIKYPHLVVGAVATSAPVLAKLNFLEYHEVVAASLASSAAGPACVTAIAQATAELQGLTKSSAGQQQIVKDFKLCQDSLTQQTDIMNFFSSVASNFDGVVQYNKDNRAFEGGPVPPTIDDVCRIVTGGPDAYQQYIAFNNFMLEAANQSCFDINYANMVSTLRNTSWDSDAAQGGRQWTYQTCVEFGYFQSSDSAKQPFGSLFPVSFSLQQCRDIYSLPGPDVSWTNTFYGGLNVSSTNIVFPNGDVDPWHALSLVADGAASIDAIYIHGTAHCANMYPPSPNDPQQLTDAREQIAQHIQRWLNN